jgi:uncharacterized protein (DUF4415 family)
MAKRRKNSDDTPEMGREFFAKAERIADGDAALLNAMRRTRGPQKAPTKRLVSLRLSPSVLAAYRKTGRGWQARINQDLERAAKRLRRSGNVS